MLSHFFKQVDIRFLTLLALLVMLVPASWAIDHPRELAGVWKGSNGLEYEIQVNGLEVILLKPVGYSTERQPHRGRFNQTGFELEFKPREDHHLNLELPFKVRHTLLSSPEYKQMDRLDLSTPGKIIYVDRINWITWDGKENVTDIKYNYKEERITLTRPNDYYKIGEITIDDSRRRQRIASEVAQMQAQIDELRTVRQPALEQELTTSEQEMKAAEDAFQQATNRYEDLSGQLKATSEQLRQLAESKKPAYQQLLADRDQLLKEVDALLSVKNDYFKTGNMQGVNSMDRQLRGKYNDLERLNQRLVREFPEDQQIKELTNNIENLKAERQAAFNEYYQGMLAYDRAVEAHLQKQKELGRLQAQISRREQELAYRQRPVVVSKIRLMVGGEVPFEAEASQEQGTLQRFEEDIAQVDQNLVQLNQSLHGLMQQEEAIAQQRQQAKERFLEAAQELKAAGDSVYNTQIGSMIGRAAAETAAYGADVFMAFKDGGLVGVTVELGGKLLEAYLQEGETFELFDETALREQMMGPMIASHPLHQAYVAAQNEQGETAPAHYPVIDGETQPQDSNMVDQVSGFGTEFAMSQKDKLIIVTPLKELATRGVNIYKYHDAMGQMDAAREMLQKNAQVSRVDFPDHQALNPLAQAQEDAFSRYLQSRELVNQAEDRLARTTNPLLRKEAQEQLAHATRLQRAAQNNYNHLVQEQALQAQKISRARRGIAEATEHLDTLKEAGQGSITKSLKNMGSGVAKGLAVDLLKAAAHKWADHEEREAWIHFFEKEIAMQANRQIFQKASNNFWNHQDAIKNHQELIQTLSQIRTALENDRSRYLASKGDGGFYIVNNQGFQPKESTVMILSLMGYVGSEEVRLAETVSGHPVQLRLQSGLEENARSLDHTDHAYRFQPNAIKSIQVKDNLLPLRIQLL